MAAAWVHAVTSITKESQLAAVYDQESRIGSETRIVVRVAERFTGTSTLTSRLYAILAAAMANLNAGRVEVAQRRWGV